MGMLALFAAVSLGAFAAFVAVVSKIFVRMNASLTADRTTSDYKMRELRESSPKKALLRKEFKRFSSSSAYVLNTAVGVVMLVVGSVILLVVGARQALEAFGYYEIFGGILATAAPLGMGFFIVLTCPAASSVSLEGKSLWITKSLPVRSRDVLMAKLNVNLTLTTLATLVSGTLLIVTLRPQPLQALFIYLTPLLYGTFTAGFGLALNLAFPRFDWDTELTVIKRGMPVMAVTLVGMAITMVPAILTLLFGAAVLYVTTAALAAMSVIFYRNIVTKGVARFDGFPG
jgi:ABC-2 type transport system permease protein